MIDLLVKMIGSAGKDNTLDIMFLHVGQGLLTLLLHGPVNDLQFLPALLDSQADLAGIQVKAFAQFLGQSLLQMMGALEGHEWIHEKD